MLALLLVGPASLTVAARTMPKQQAAHFCRLLIYDGNEVCPLSIHAHRLAVEDDSLTAEQLMTSFIFHKDNWQTLRIFPHKADDGTISWYAPSDKLPPFIDSEHQKYIREVLPRLRHEIEAGQWEAVDAYIDRMIQYQCQFGGSHTKPTPSALTLSLLFFALAALLAGVILIGRRHKKSAKSKR